MIREIIISIKMKGTPIFTRIYVAEPFAHFTISVIPSPIRKIAPVVKPVTNPINISFLIVLMFIYF